MSSSEILGLMAGLTSAIAATIYLLHMLRGKNTPNPATWFIWAVVHTMNTVSYVMLNGVFRDWQNSLIAVVMAIMIITIFVTAWKRSHFSKFSRKDAYALVGALIVGIIWKLTKDEQIANLLIQVLLIYSFWPTIVGLLKKQAQENPLAWSVAVLAYFLTIAAITSNSTFSMSNDWVKLVYPFVNGILGNGSVAVISIIIRYKTRFS